MPSNDLCNGRIFPGLLSRFFFLFSIDLQVLHDLEGEYENDLLASIDPEQPV